MQLEEIKDIIQQTLQSQIYGVYNTIRNEQPHSALVGFAPTPDLSKIIILTPKNTRKYVNTQLYHKVTLFISTTTNDPKDLENAITISISGIAEVSDKLQQNQIAEYRKYYLEKNKHMNQLADSLNEMIVISVDKYELTKSFQKSVIQTNTDMTTLGIRQLAGISLVNGIARGKVHKINSLSDLKQVHETSIVIVNNIVESDSLQDIKPKGLVIGNNTISKQLEDTLKANKIPTVLDIGKDIESIKSGVELTVNGSLGVIIFHEIKN